MERLGLYLAIGTILLGVWISLTILSILVTFIIDAKFEAF